VYDSHIPLEDQQILVRIIQSLIQNDGSGPYKKITSRDVVRTFLDNFEALTQQSLILKNIGNLKISKII